MLDENDDDDNDEAEYKTRTNVYGESNENKQMRMRPTYYGNCYLFVNDFILKKNVKAFYSSWEVFKANFPP